MAMATTNVGVAMAKVQRVVIRLPLHRGGRVVAYALVDAQDVVQAAHRWRLDSEGYAARKTEGCEVRLHRVILGLSVGDGLEVDHLNGDRLDYRRANLVVTTHAANMQNVRSRRPHLPRGVYVAAHGRYYAQVKHRGVKHCLGHYETTEAAAAAAAAKRRELGFHGSEAAR